LALFEMESPVLKSIFLSFVIFAMLTPLVTSAQQPATSPAKDVAGDMAKNVPKAYLPGLEQFMNIILIEHNKLWFAGKARNWRLAEYQLGEIKEIMGDVQDIVPTFKNLHLADMLDAVLTKEIVALEKSIEAKDQKAFVVSYDKLTQACNACHQGTDNNFIVIKRPTQPAVTNQDYRSRR
jgi:hypothetical protein